MINQQKRAISLNAISNVALQRFVANGYKNTTVEEIAAQARLTKAAIYYYFKSKEALLLHLLTMIQEKEIESFDPKPVTPDETVLQRLRRFVNSRLRWVKNEPNELMLIILMSIEFTEPGTEIKMCIDSFYEKTISVFERLIDEGKASGEFKSQLSSNEMALFFMAAHDGNMMQWRRTGHDIDAGITLANIFRNSILHTVVDRAIPFSNLDSTNVARDVS